MTDTATQDIATQHPNTPQTNPNAPTTRQDAIKAARESFSGRTLTQSQFREAVAIAGILRTEINQSGSFHEKLTDYAHAYARNARFDAMRGETIVRDIYAGYYGQTLNQTREALLEREKQAPENHTHLIDQSIERAFALIKDGPTQPFYLAKDRTSLALAKELGTTRKHAGKLMDERHEAQHGKSLYEDGKVLEEAYHKPVREAQIAARKAEHIETRSRSRSME